MLAVTDHKGARQSETVSLRREMEAVFGFSAPADPAPDPAPVEVASLPGNIERLVELAAAHEAEIRSAFATSHLKKQSATVRERQLYRSLREAESLAAGIRSLVERPQVERPQ